MDLLSVLATNKLSSMSDSLDSLTDRRWVRRSFSNSAAGYDGVADLQRQVGHHLIDWALHSGSEFKMMLDLGAGTGYFADELGRRFPEGKLILLDIAEGMMRVARERIANGGGLVICGEAENLPLETAAFDLVFSNLALQWSHDLRKALQEIYRVLKPGGRLAFSTFGKATLSELRRAWSFSDEYSHVSQFFRDHEIEAEILASGFSEIYSMTETRVIEYPDVMSLMRELKGLGARNMTDGRARHLTGKDRLKRMIEAYEVAGTNGSIKATFETVYFSVARSS